MSYTTAIRYDVLEHVLKAWLLETFGPSQSRTGPVWSCTVIGEGHSSMWQVSAPREITNDEQDTLILRSQPRGASSFGR
ncbi:hypothetical protein CEP54_012363 [Fusarium duplospermum]|uniref:Uncharacterized protein n=1 Tax=Fusarium duplospermum TaxID=1325734 RepID=A0A428P9A4_9HYPO|nr:hypothetical protein CEP54_012363 [Fusarium duplospermum]